MWELTLDQMGKEISAAIQTLTLVQRKVIGRIVVERVEKACWNFEEGRITADRVSVGVLVYAFTVSALTGMTSTTIIAARGITLLRGEQ